MYLIIAIIPKQFQSSESKHTTKHNTVSPNPSLRLKGLAQARHSRSGESPLPRRGLEKNIKKQRGISLRRDPSRLGEMFARSKFWAGRLGESLFVSHRRDWLAWARLIGLATVPPAAVMFFKPTKHTKYSHASKRRINPYNQQPTQTQAKTTRN